MSRQATVAEVLAVGQAERDGRAVTWEDLIRCERLVRDIEQGSGGDGDIGDNTITGEVDDAVVKQSN